MQKQKVRSTSMLHNEFTSTTTKKPVLREQVVLPMSILKEVFFLFSFFSLLSFRFRHVIHHEKENLPSLDFINNYSIQQNFQ